MLFTRDWIFQTGIAILLMVSFISVSAQNREPVPCDSLLFHLYEPSLTGTLYQKPVNTSYSVYFSDEWLNGTLELSNGLMMKKIYLKYNGYTDRVIWIRDDYQQVSLDPEPILSFTLTERNVPGKTSKFDRILIQETSIGKPEFVFAQLLYRDSISLYAVRKVIRIGKDEEKSNRFLDEIYKKINIYYFKYGEHFTFGFRKINRTNLQNTLPGKKEELAGMMKKERQNRVRTEEDLIRFTEWLNEKSKLRQ